MVLYKVPDEHYFRLHHIRPRFKGNVEKVLIFFATEAAEIPELEKGEFIKKLNNAIKLFPGNATKKSKTINNWRTEISSLFGFLVYNTKESKIAPSSIAIKLAKNQDLVEFFKIFLYTFQYPGGHLKSHEVKKCIEAHIRFRPAKYILEVLNAGGRGRRRGGYITKAEATHCIFNDLRVTAGGRTASTTLKLLMENRENGVAYDWRGDVIRYAGDILDYLTYANLLTKRGEKYYLNMGEAETIDAFLKSKFWYDGYKQFYGKRFDISDLKNAQFRWFSYIDAAAQNLSFETDLSSFIGAEGKYPKVKLVTSSELREFIRKQKTPKEIKTKEIGDKGEGLIYGHECMRLKLGRRQDLISKVRAIPDFLGLGFDIRSFEIDMGENVRLVEVKTTISNSAIDFKQFTMTENEWNAAQNYKEKYYVYRLVVTRTQQTLFIIKNPVDKYKKDKLMMKVSNGVQLKFKDSAGSYERLLKWEE